ncbi:hypothetical protein V1508DRAFT_426964, partial [Lipomyces doorenjongii]|uniref:uncharacterized protein n=1 Tax=Lipomyces doorenjongii TaxID=383834 RepID=UPI0034CE6684
FYTSSSPAGDEPVENVSLTSGLQSPIESSFELGPEDSISQIVDPSLSRNLTDETQEISPVLTDDKISSQWDCESVALGAV